MRDIIKPEGYRVTISVKVTAKDGTNKTLYCHPQSTKSFYEDDLENIDSIILRIIKEWELSEYKKAAMFD